ncbi:MAG TPA: S24/S26 family peptidase [Candidatus Mediterraneibacter ornithocaccae]|nr:S24/S26 family peptidase [Candidatus Mediterraneibacter ornithocaccae]
MIERVVDTNEYVTVLRELAGEGRVVSMLVAGSSMSPFLCHKRDYIYFTKPDRELRRGDMVFYQRDTGQYVMHRVYKRKKDGYYMVGDAQTQIEGPLRRDQIFARIIKVKRKGRIIEPGNFWWEFFEHVWIRIIPLRKVIEKLYSLWGQKHR